VERAGDISAEAAEDDAALGRAASEAQRSNWLPAPNGDFSLYLRSYWPEQAILDGSWTPPAIERVAR
jgi:hypothetical protein